MTYMIYLNVLFWWGGISLGAMSSYVQSYILAVLRDSSWQCKGGQTRIGHMQGSALSPEKLHARKCLIPCAISQDPV